MSHLVEEHSSVDPTYVEDFLLTYRTFLKSPMEISEKLLAWFNDPKIRDRVSSYLYPGGMGEEEEGGGLTCIQVGWVRRRRGGAYLYPGGMGEEGGSLPVSRWDG